MPSPPPTLCHLHHPRSPPPSPKLAPLQSPDSPLFHEVVWTSASLNQSGSYRCASQLAPKAPRRHKRALSRGNSVAMEHRRLRPISQRIKGPFPSLPISNPAPPACLLLLCLKGFLPVSLKAAECMLVITLRKPPEGCGGRPSECLP